MTSVPEPSPPGAAPPVQEASSARTPGEFTQIFGSKDSVRKPSAPLPATAAPRQSGPGEFTRFFSSGTPSPARPERGSDPNVQRPGDLPIVTPSTPPSSQNAQGEFTKLFTGAPPRQDTPILPSSTASPSAPVDPFRGGSPGRGGTVGEFTRMFGGRTDAQPPSSSGAGPTPGEYTQLFGKKNAAPVSPQAQMTPAKASFLPSLNEIGPGAPGSPAANPGSAEPGEFTRIVGSPIPPNAGGPGGPGVGAPAGHAGSGGGSPIQVNVNPQNPLGSVRAPALKIPNASVAGGGGSASVAGPSMTPGSVSGAGAHAPGVTPPHMNMHAPGLNVAASAKLPPVTAAPDAAPVSSKSRTGLLILFAVLLILALALILFVVVRG